MGLILPVELELTTEPGMSVDEIEGQYQNCYQAQKAIDEYCNGIGTEDDLIAKLEYYGVNWEDLIDILEFNMVMRYGIQA